MASKRKSSDDNGDGEESPTRAGGSKRQGVGEETVDEFMKKLEPRDCQLVQKLRQKYRFNVPHSSSRMHKYRLQFRNKLPKTLLTDTEFRVSEIVLVDASNNVITTGPMAIAEIEIVVLDGDLNVDEHGEWTEEEFMNYILKPREGKGQLLIGNLSTKLLNGIGRMSDATFTDISSWANRHKSFRLGVRGMAKEVQEGISNPFRVKDRHVKCYQKDRLLSMNDEVCCLKGIYNNGPRHKKLIECKINTVPNMSFEDLPEENGRSSVPNNFDIASPLLRDKWLMLLFVARLKMAAPRPRESKYSETSSPRCNWFTLLFIASLKVTVLRFRKRKQSETSSSRENALKY